MAEPDLVADCVKAMLDAVHDSAKMPITVKHRIGINKTEDTPESYGFVRDFVGKVADAGCQTFIVHARNAWLKGLSPKENRDIPPLRYEIVHQLKADFPHLNIAINGGITTNVQIAEQLQGLDGVGNRSIPLDGVRLITTRGCWRRGMRRSLAQTRKLKRASRLKPKWSPTWSANRRLTARTGHRLRGTCWVCGMVWRVRGAGGRFGVTTSCATYRLRK
jgi:tRNA-dihydrouridine synthase A